jgi:ABC-type lipoprotein release transport system permease subunit
MFATLRIALMAIRRNVLRSFLTMLGIIVGIAAVIVGVSMGTGAKAEVDKRIAGMGQNLITVMSGNMTRGGVRGRRVHAPRHTGRKKDDEKNPHGKLRRLHFHPGALSRLLQRGEMRGH